MTYVEAKGKTVDEAIFNGLEQLELSLDEVDIEIVHEGSKGLFGLGKSALGKDPTQQIGQFEGNEEGIRGHSGAKCARDDGVANKAQHP